MATSVDQVAADLNRLFESTKEEFDKIVTNHVEAKKEVKEAKEMVEDMKHVIQRNVVQQLADFKSEMQVLESAVKYEFVKNKEEVKEEFVKGKTEHDNMAKVAGELFADNTAQMNATTLKLEGLKVDCLNAFKNLETKTT